MVIYFYKMTSLEQRVEELEREVDRYDHLLDYTQENRDDIHYLQNTVQHILDYLSNLQSYRNKIIELLVNLQNEGQK